MLGTIVMSKLGAETINEIVDKIYIMFDKTAKILSVQYGRKFRYETERCIDLVSMKIVKERSTIS